MSDRSLLRVRLAAAARRARGVHDAPRRRERGAVGLVQSRRARRRCARGRGGQSRASARAAGAARRARLAQPGAWHRGRRSRSRRSIARVPVTADAAITRARARRLRDHGRRLPAGAVRQPRWHGASAPRTPAGAGSPPACSRAPWPRSACRAASSRPGWVPRSRSEHFEVGEEVRAAFVDGRRGRRAAFHAQRARPLAGRSRRASRAAASRALGVDRRHGGQLVHFADRERFFSHRRDGEGRPHGRAHLACDGDARVLGSSPP